MKVALARSSGRLHPACSKDMRRSCVRRLYLVKGYARLTETRTHSRCSKFTHSYASWMAKNVVGACSILILKEKYSCDTGHKNMQLVIGSEGGMIEEAGVVFRYECRMICDIYSGKNLRAHGRERYVLLFVNITLDRPVVVGRLTKDACEISSLLIR